MTNHHLQKMNAARARLMTATRTGNDEQIAAARREYHDARAMYRASKNREALRAASEEAFRETLVDTVRDYRDRDSIGGDDLNPTTRRVMIEIAYQLLDYVGDHPICDSGSTDELDRDQINDVIEYAYERA